MSDPDLSRALRHDPYRWIFENAPIGILHFDAQGMVTDCNPSFVRIVGSSLPAVLGQDLLALRDPGIVRCVREVLAGRRATYDGECRSLQSDEVSVIRAHASPLLGAGGRVLAGIGLVEDRNDQDHLEARLAHASRMASLGTLAAGLAHEINNPLSFIATSIDVATREIERALRGGGRSALAAALTQLGEAREGADRIGLIVRDVKGFSRTDARTRSLVDVGPVIDSSIALAWNEIRHRARFSSRCDVRSPVWAHAHRLGQVFVNLLVNAAQAIPKGGDPAAFEISLSAYEAAGQLVVEVRDTGVGIDPSKRGRIFEPFWTDKPLEGTGLGLSICHGIITGYGGEISVESTPGRGSTFRVRLPVATVDPALEGGRSTPEPHPVVGGARLLVIDDEPRVGSSLARALEHHDVVAVDGGRAAVELLATDQGFDLILCDMAMPTVGGMGVFEDIKRVSLTLSERVVFMTGGVFTESERAFLEGGSRRWLEKPFRIDEVEALLRELRRAD